LHSAESQLDLHGRTHHHQGQLAAMCRLPGRPCEGLDSPLD